MMNHLHISQISHVALSIICHNLMNNLNNIIRADKIRFVDKVSDTFWMIDKKYNI